MVDTALRGVNKEAWLWLVLIGEYQGDAPFLSCISGDGFLFPLVETTFSSPQNL